MATDSRRRDWRDGALVGLAGLLILLIADALVKDATAPKGDDQIYELMAHDPFATHSFPFAYRFLVPTIVHVLPFGHTFSFSLLAWLSTAACGTVAYVLMRRFAVQPWLAAAWRSASSSARSCSSSRCARAATSTRRPCSSCSPAAWRSPTAGRSRSASRSRSAPRSASRRCS